MTNEQTIDEIMKAPARETWQYGVKTDWYTLDQVTAALAAKDAAMAVIEAESAAMADALKQIAEAVGLGVGHTAAEIVAAVTAKYAEIERLKAQLAEPAEPAPGEWIEWAGGECPLKDSVRHSIRKRDGWQSAPDIAAADWYGWRHNGSSADIVAYRVLA